MPDAWRDRFVHREVVAPDQLLANPYNMRIHTTFQQKVVEGSLDELGWVDDVRVNRTTGNIFDGHLRVILALRRSETGVPVSYYDLTPEEEYKALLYLDPSAALAATDAEKLAEVQRMIHTDNASIQEFMGKLADESRLYSGGDSTPPSLDDLANQYGDPNERDFWPILKIQVSPEIEKRYKAVMAVLPGADEAEKFEALIVCAEQRG